MTFHSLVETQRDTAVRAVLSVPLTRPTLGEDNEP